MNYQDFAESQELLFTVQVDVGDSQNIATITGTSYEDIGEQWRKLERAIDRHIDQQWNELPDNLNEERYEIHDR